MPRMVERGKRRASSVPCGASGRTRKEGWKLTRRKDTEQEDCPTDVGHITPEPRVSLRSFRRMDCANSDRWLWTITDRGGIGLVQDPGRRGIFQMPESAIHMLGSIA